MPGGNDTTVSRTVNLNVECDRIKCDGDGFTLQANKEARLPTYFHTFPPAQIRSVEVRGDAAVGFLGFGGQSLQPMPPVGFNLTFVCPVGQVFEADWLAAPFVMSTCQVCVCISCIVTV